MLFKFYEREGENNSVIAKGKTKIPIGKPAQSNRSPSDSKGLSESVPSI